MLNVEMGEAHFSPNRVYRYALTRVWDPARPMCMFVGLNPSTADETKLDPTLRRVVGFADRERFGGFWMGNLFAFRATDPKDMRAAAEPIGPESDAWLLKMAGAVQLVICGWGAHGDHLGRDSAVVELLRAGGHGAKLRCLGRTAKGHPRHPLYLSKVTKLEDY